MLKHFLSEFSLYCWNSLSQNLSLVHLLYFSPNYTTLRYIFKYFEQYLIRYVLAKHAMSGYGGVLSTAPHFLNFCVRLLGMVFWKRQDLLKAGERFVKIFWKRKDFRTCSRRMFCNVWTSFHDSFWKYLLCINATKHFRYSIAFFRIVYRTRFIFEIPIPPTTISFARIFFLLHHF